MARRPTKSKYFPTINGTVGGAIEVAINDLREIGSECQESHDSMPESLQGGAKGGALEEAASTLEGLDDVGVPDIIAELPCSWREDHRRRTGRPVRVGNACAAIDAAISAIDAWLDDEGNGTEEERNAAQECRDNAEEIKDEAEGVALPGMYG